MRGKWDKILKVHYNCFLKDLVLLTTYNETQNQLLGLLQIVKLINKLEKALNDGRDG